MGEHWSRLRRSSHSQAGISGALGELGMEDTSLPCAANFARAIAVLWPELSRLPHPVCCFATVLPQPLGEETSQPCVPQVVWGLLKPG